jgi:hypothetical protein
LVDAAESSSGTEVVVEMETLQGKEKGKEAEEETTKGKEKEEENVMEIEVDSLAVKDVREREDKDSTRS